MVYRKEGVKVYAVFPFVLLFTLVHFSQVKASTLEELEAAYKQYRELRKQGDKYMPISPTANNNESVEISICVSCPKITNLTGEVNKVMRHMVETNQIDNEELGTLEEVERLEAMYYVVQYDMEKAKQLIPDFPLEECVHYPLDVYLRYLDREPIADERLTEIFTFKVPLDNVNALHYRSRAEKARYYFYRAAYPHQDKIIRVYIPTSGQGQVTVSYFQLDKLPSRDESSLMKDIERKRREAQFNADPETGEEKPKVFGMEYWGGLGRYKSETTEWEAGLAIAHKDNLPRRILLLKGKDESEIIEGLKLGTEVEISDRDQEVRFNLAYEGQDLVRFKGEADGDYRAEVPFQVSLQEYGFTTKGSIAKTESGDEAMISFFQDGASIIHVKGRKGIDNTQSVTVGNTFNDVLGGTVSIDYQRNKNPNDIENPDQETFWVRYRSTF